MFRNYYYYYYYYYYYARCAGMQVYALSWVEKKLAATFFATPPTASIDDALKNFLKVRHHPSSRIIGFKL